MGTAAQQADTHDRLASELELVRGGTGLIDRSERGKLALEGADAIEFLNGQVTNELAGLTPSEGRYAAFLTHKGKMLGDMRILAVPDGGPGGGGLDAGMLLLDTERVALQALFDMIRRFKVGFGVELHKRTVERGLLSLLGPGSAAVAGAPGLADTEHSCAQVEIDSVQALAVRTDLGVDLFCEADTRERLWSSLQDRGAGVIEEQTAECVRIESGRPRYGLDLDDTVIPQEAGLNERAVSFTKGCYVGQETVARLFYKGRPNRHLRGLRLSGPAPGGSELRLHGREVGRLGSSARSPRLGPIGLALVRREAEPGSTVEVGGQGLTAEVLELPFPAAPAPG
jgi:folate-binding protein YgfZ